MFYSTMNVLLAQHDSEVTMERLMFPDGIPSKKKQSSVDSSPRANPFFLGLGLPPFAPLMANDMRGIGPLQPVSLPSVAG